MSRFLIGARDLQSTWGPDRIPILAHVKLAGEQAESAAALVEER